MSVPNDLEISPKHPSEVATSPLGMRLEVKRIIKARDPVTGKWETYEDSPGFTPGGTDDGKGKYARFAEYAFIVRRKMWQEAVASSIPTVTTRILIQSEYLKKAMKVPRNVHPFKVDPQLLLAFLPHLKDFVKYQRSKDMPAEDRTVDHFSFLFSFLEDEFAPQLQKIKDLTSHDEVTFELLWAILLPKSVLFTSCTITSEPRAVRLQSIRRLTRWGDLYWNLVCEYVAVNDRFASPDHHFGLATIEIEIPHFDGTMKIDELNVYPIERHPSYSEVKAKLIERGRRWVRLIGVHHVRYNGMAYRDSVSSKPQERNVNIDGRIMIDRETFANAEPNYARQSATRTLSGAPLNNHGLGVHKADDGAPTSTEAQHLQDDDLLLTSPILYGFSLYDKLWLNFNVEHVSSIEWNDQVFRNLTLEPERKHLVQSLVESHAQHKSFDDFVKRKGLGLVFNLFGPPGVGKSLTVEAVSEHLHRPLYMVSAGELGTDPLTLDKALTKIFAMAPVWDAVVLIDEADVFLEERGATDVVHNAMVAVFLRQLEYFRGILFLTTNRVKTFDQAFQSRIQLSLHYDDLSRPARGQLWRAFLEKVRKTLNRDEVRELSKKELNGRQIKNVVKLAVALSNREGEGLSFKHLMRTMHTVDDGVSHRSAALAVPDIDSQLLRFLGLGLLATCSLLYTLRSR